MPSLDGSSNIAAIRPRVRAPDAYRRRRALESLVVALSGILLPSGSIAQSPAKVWVIGVLNPRTRSSPGSADAYTRFFAAMRALGYVDGRNITIRWQFADNEVEKLPALAAQLVKAKVDLIVTNGTPAVRSAQHATTTIPVLALTFTDPVSNKFAISLARPGGNITGTTIIEEDLLIKRMEILAEILPHAKRIAYLANPDNTMEALKYSRLEAAARKSGIATALVEARAEKELSAAFDAMVRERANALLVAADTVFLDHAQRIGALALQRKLPSMMSVESVAEFCMATYGPDPVRRGQRAAALADKILKGANPAELPIELPTHFNFVINLRVAKALAMTIPPVVMVQATKVIQ